jgi:tetratricopeptide (TPR) repeat protein
MSAYRRFLRSGVLGVAVALASVIATGAATQDVSVQKLLERGALDEAVQRAETERDNPESTYLAAQALIKKGDNGRATEEYGRLRERSDDDWKAIGESGATLLVGDNDGAMAAAERAIAANDGNPYGHYQVGMVAIRQENFQRAADAFGRSVELKPDFAYAHYYAGIAHQRLRQIPQMSEHLEAFLRLAPDAPERSAVAAILRTLRP